MYNQSERTGYYLAIRRKGVGQTNIAAFRDSAALTITPSITP